MTKFLSTAALMLALATPAFAGGHGTAEKYTLDASHSQIVFSYNHLGYSTTFGMFSGFEGEIMWNKDAPEKSSVTVSMPASMMFTGWEARDKHLLSGDFINAADNEIVSFACTGIEVTGDDTALITGDLTVAGTTVSVVLDAKLNQAGEHPMAKKDWAGFDATTTLKRSDFGVGNFAPFVGDEVEVIISIEAQKADVS